MTWREETVRKMFRIAIISVLAFLAAGFSYFALTGSAGAQTFEANINLSEADASFWGEDSSDHAGWSVAPAGDVNGDGYDDILIGAYGEDSGGADAGQTYLILGKASGWAIDTDLSLADASFIGENAGDYSGYSVAPAGDVNNDGYDDILIGAYGNDDGGDDAGQTYLILGKATGWTMDTGLSLADASFIGENAEDYSGYSVAPAGDVNNDGYDDILIGAYGNDEDGTDAGQTYLILGKATGWTMDTGLSLADASFIGESSNDFSGWSVASAGNVNNDSYDDIIIGAYGNDDGGADAGQTYLVLGKATGWTMDTGLSLANASFIGESANDFSGWSVASAGNVNNDSYDDILIGAYSNSEGGADAGQTYLILGKTAGWAMDTGLSSADASFIGEDADDYSGYPVAPAGDINGDGYDDILIGAGGDDEGGSDAGKTYLILGKTSGWAMDTGLSSADASFFGEDAGDYSGLKVASAGDVNGDGCDEILIGAYGNDDGGIDAGQTYLLYYNSPPDQPGNISPGSGIVTGLTPTLYASSFYSDDGRSHAASKWQVTATSGDYSSPAWDSDIDTASLTSIVIPSDTLLDNTTYYWHVSYRDDNGAWSAYSAESSFITDAGSPLLTVTELKIDPYGHTLPALTGKATDTCVAIVSVKYRIDGGNWTAVTYSPDGSSGLLAVTYTINSSALSEEGHEIEIEAVDSAGNTGYTTYTTTGPNTGITPVADEGEVTFWLFLVFVFSGLFVLSGASYVILWWRERGIGSIA